MYTHEVISIDSFEDTPSEAGVNCIKRKMDSEKYMAEVVLLNVKVFLNQC